jgi:uncharacterized membrane protein YjjP (DUF1212 family)
MSPNESRDVEEFLLELGIAELSAGYPVDEVTNTLTRVSRALGRDEMTFVTLPNSIVFDDPSTGRARAISESNHTLRMDQAAAVHRISREAAGGTLTAADGVVQLQAIPAMPPRFPAWATLLGYGLVSAAFALIFRVSLFGVAVAAILGLVVGLMQREGVRRPSIAALVPPVAALVCAVSVFGFSSILNQNAESLRVVAAPLVSLIPGIALTRGTLELAAGHVISGSARLVSALVQILVLTFGILVGMQIAKVSPYDLTDLPKNLLPWWVPLIGVVVYAIGQAFVYNEPHGAIRIVVALLLVAFLVQSVCNLFLDSVFSAGIAAAAALLIAVVIQLKVKRAPLPAFVLFQPVFFLIVPGSLGLIGATEAFTAGQLGPALSNQNALLTTAATVIAITIGMQIGSLIGRTITPFVNLRPSRSGATDPMG